MTDPHRPRLRHLGITEHRADLDGTHLNYAEGPDNGPPLLLIHGQGSQWTDHAKVLPTLIRDHHVHAVDVPGHGRSDPLPDGGYTNIGLGTRLARFVDTVIGAPTLVSGHSSGGLLALWLAAERPDLVNGLLLEDPPLFSSVPPRAANTTGAILPRLAARHLREDCTADFQRCYVESGEYFAFFGPFAPALIRYSLRRLDKHPDEALRIPFLPPLVNVFFQGLVDYDPAFGRAWDDGSWYDGFDTAAALRAVTTPTTLIHTNWWHRKHGTSYSEAGILMAAMDVDDAARAAKLLADVATVTIASGHLVHFERPKAYLSALATLAQRVDDGRDGN